jgi:N-methylhydantoinase A
MQEEALHALPIRSVDIRYVGQGYELQVPWSNNFVSDFHRLHEQRYGYSDPHRPVEVVNARVRMVATAERLEFARREMRPGDGAQAIRKRKQFYLEGEWVPGAIYDRDELRPGDRFRGPAVVVEYSATTFLPPDGTATVDELSNLLIELHQ